MIANIFFGIIGGLILLLGAFLWISSETIMHQLHAMLVCIFAMQFAAAAK